MQNRIHSLEDRIFIYKSLGVSPNRRIYCGSIFCKSVKLAEPLDAKPHVWQFDVNVEEWGDTVKWRLESLALMHQKTLPL